MRASYLLINKFIARLPIKMWYTWRSLSLSLSGGRREDDWTCPSCGNVNFSFRTTCNMHNCTQSRPADHNTVSEAHLIGSLDRELYVYIFAQTACIGPLAFHV